MDLSEMRDACIELMDHVTCVESVLISCTAETVTDEILDAFKWAFRELGETIGRVSVGMDAMPEKFRETLLYYLPLDPKVEPITCAVNAAMGVEGKIDGRSLADLLANYETMLDAPPEVFSRALAMMDLPAAKKRKRHDWTAKTAEAIAILSEDKEGLCLGWTDTEWARRLKLKRQTYLDSPTHKKIKALAATHSRDLQSGTRFDVQ